MNSNGDQCKPMRDITGAEREISVRQFRTTKVLNCGFPDGKYNFYVQLTNAKTGEVAFSHDVNLYVKPKKYKACFTKLKEDKYKCLRKFKNEDEMYAWIDNLQRNIDTFSRNPEGLTSFFDLPHDKFNTIGDRYILTLTISYAK